MAHFARTSRRFTMTDKHSAADRRQPETEHELLRQHSFFKRLDLFDKSFAFQILMMTLIAHTKFSHDVYEAAILWTAAAGIILLGWFHKPLRRFSLGVLVTAWIAVQLYDGNIAHASDQIAAATGKAEGKFLLRYLLSSQSAIMWQCALTVLAFAAYLSGSLHARRTQRPHNLLLDLGTNLAWAGAFAGLTGLLVRWHESYLLRPDAGHIPVSSLYEVFILFMVITALMYLYYEKKFDMQRVGAFVYLLMCGLVAFVLWYSVSRGAHEIKPLIPALQSWWMKIHVPANFVGYGGFCMAAMFGVAELFALRGSRFLPDAALIEEAMYKAIAVGFLFFTIATILGALWAKDAWGGYWSWDPKEVWALVVWLNYAVWLHLRLVKGWRGKVLAWWAIVGLFITSFAFVGVNIFLSGLHSYGEL